MLCMFLGVEAEGMYRVAGFHDDVEAIKMQFDKGKNLLQLTSHGQLCAFDLYC